MDQKEIIERLKKNPAAAQALLNSPDAQALMRMLQGQDGGQALDRAASQAAGGNTAQMTQMLKNIMSTPGGAQLIKRLAKSLQK
ncbi:MAG: hypothetical protein II069_01730 [Oscillospiraceae bacterium]|jgi:hypothetical protein|nr:hypothetical protein [Oscillospiraceae bacterium]